MDMLVKLYELPEVEKFWVPDDIQVKQALPPERHIIQHWVQQQFNPHWASEVACSFNHLPVSCFVASNPTGVVGFACYEASCKGFFGPMGVDDAYRGLGVGKRLLIESLWQMRHMGYAYAIIGGVGPQEFYKKMVNAQPIDGSTPGIYRDMLR